MTSRSCSPVLGLGPCEKPKRKLTEELNSSDDDYDERVLRSSPFLLTTATTPPSNTCSSKPVARAATDTSASVVTPAAKKREAKTATKRFVAYEDVKDKKKRASTQSPKKKEKKRPANAKVKASASVPEPVAPRYRVGQVIEKFFKGYGTFSGKISVLPTADMPYYRVYYEDGDGEDIHQDDISEYVVGAAFSR